MSYRSRNRRLWPGGLTSLRLRRITSSPSQTLRRRLVPTTDDGRRWVLDACRRSSRVCFSHFATLTVDNTVDMYAAKPDIRPESRFWPTPPALNPPPLGGTFPSKYRHPVCYAKTRMVGVPDGKKIVYICLFVLTWSTIVTDRQRMTA